MRSEGELRLPGGRIAGDLDLAGAELRGSTGDALDITGVSVGGSLHAGRHVGVPGLAFAATGRVLLSGARIVGDLVFSGARIERAAEAGAVADAIQPDRVESRLPPVPVGIIDAGTCVVADRVQVEGNLELDDGLSTDGTIRLPNATVGGYLRLSGARLSGPYGASETGSRCWPTAWRWGATWKDATTAAVHSCAPGRCAWSAPGCAAVPACPGSSWQRPTATRCWRTGCTSAASSTSAASAARAPSASTTPRSAPHSTAPAPVWNDHGSGRTAASARR